MLNPYLTFNGNCREAFEFYRSVFGGEFSALMTFHDMPPGLTVPADELDKVMHASLPVGECVLMGSDSCSAMGPDANVGDNFCICIRGESREYCDEVCKALSEGGEIKMQPQEMFWGGYFAMWVDRFGVGWMVSYDPPPG